MVGADEEGDNVDEKLDGLPLLLDSMRDVFLDVEEADKVAGDAVPALEDDWDRLVAEGDDFP